TSTGPRVNQTSLRARMSVATAVYGMGRSSIRTSSSIAPITPMIRLARIAPPPAKETSSSRRTSRWDSPRTHASNSSSLPAASSAPTIAPIEAPETPTTSWPRDSSSRIAPMCAYPRAPPEPSASATRMPLPPSSRLSPGRPGPRVRGTGARVTVRSGGYAQPCGKCVATRESRGPARIAGGARRARDLRGGPDRAPVRSRTRRTPENRGALMTRNGLPSRTAHLRTARALTDRSRARRPGRPRGRAARRSRAPGPALAGARDPEMERVARNIALHGLHLVHVGEGCDCADCTEPAAPPEERFGYTIGLTARGHPELLVRGLGAQETAELLNRWGRTVLAGDV